MIRQALVVLLALLLSACATAVAPRVTFAPAAAGPAAPRPVTCLIEVFRDLRPDRPFTELGVINFHKEWHRLGRGYTVESALPDIKARACQAGADAVMIHVTEERRLEFAMLHVTATAVRFDSR